MTRAALLPLALLGLAATLLPTGASASRPQTSARLGKLDAFTCTLPAGVRRLPAGARHGLIGHMRQYPELGLATPRERRAARQLLRALRNEAARWSAPGAVRRQGFIVQTVPRAADDRSAHYVHAEARRERPATNRLDLHRPKALIYANEPGRPLELVGVMFSMRRGIRGPTPGGPITRWHSHQICAVGTKRGLAPLANGSCPPGATRHQGSEMMHVWFTRDLRSAFAVRAPEPELCRDGLLRGRSCEHPSGSKGM